MSAPAAKIETASARHTPGPWVVGYRAFEVTACDGRMKVCDIRGWGYLTGKCAMGLTDAEGEAIQTANARLIAAAPDIYEALEALVEKFDTIDGQPFVNPPGNVWHNARAALAKARGEQP